MRTELRNSFGATIDRALNLPDELAYTLRPEDEVTWAGGACYVVIRKHWNVQGDLKTELTLFVKERE